MRAHSRLHGRELRCKRERTAWGAIRERDIARGSRIYAKVQSLRKLKLRENRSFAIVAAIRREEGSLWLWLWWVVRDSNWPSLREIREALGLEVWE